MANQKDNQGNRKDNQGNQGNREQAPGERRQDVGQGGQKGQPQGGQGQQRQGGQGQGGQQRQGDQGNRNPGSPGRDPQVGQGPGTGRQSQEDLDKRREAQSGPGATGRPGGRDAEIDDEQIGDEEPKGEPWKLDDETRPRH